MTRDHLLGFPALLRQHDEPVVPKEQTVKERPAAFVAFEKGDWAPKMTVGVDLGAPETREITYDDVFGAIRKLVAELGKPAAVAILAEFAAQRGTDLKPEQWAEFIATAERRLAGWIKWSGGEQPVVEYRVVVKKAKQGSISAKF